MRRYIRSEYARLPYCPFCGLQNPSHTHVELYCARHHWYWSHLWHKLSFIEQEYEEVPFEVIEKLRENVRWGVPSDFDVERFNSVKKILDKIGAQMAPFNTPYDGIYIPTDTELWERIRAHEKHLRQLLEEEEHDDEAGKTESPV